MPVAEHALGHLESLIRFDVAADHKDSVIRPVVGLMKLDYVFALDAIDGLRRARQEVAVGAEPKTTRVATKRAIRPTLLMSTES